MASEVDTFEYNLAWVCEPCRGSFCHRKTDGEIAVLRYI